MAPTTQALALSKVQKMFGQSGFAQDHVGFCVVGCKRMMPLTLPDGQVVSRQQTIRGIGDTWDEAIAELERKIR